MNGRSHGRVLLLSPEVWECYRQAITTGNAGPTLRQTYLASDAKLPGKKLLTQLSWNKIILVKVNDTAVTILCPLR